MDLMQALRDTGMLKAPAKVRAVGRPQLDRAGYRYPRMTEVQVGSVNGKPVMSKVVTWHRAADLGKRMYRETALGCDIYVMTRQGFVCVRKAA